MWVNPVEIAKILDEFPLQKLDELKWINEAPEKLWFKAKLDILIRDLLQGSSNSLAIPQSRSL